LYLYLVKCDILLSLNLTGKASFPVVSFGIRDSKDSWNEIPAIQRNFAKFLEAEGMKFLLSLEIRRISETGRGFQPFIGSPPLF